MNDANGKTLIRLAAVLSAIVAMFYFRYNHVRRLDLLSVDVLLPLIMVSLFAISLIVMTIAAIGINQKRWKDFARRHSLTYRVHNTRGLVIEGKFDGKHIMIRNDKSGKTVLSSGGRDIDITTWLYGESASLGSTSDSTAFDKVVRRALFHTEGVNLPNLIRDKGR